MTARFGGDAPPASPDAVPTPGVVDLSHADLAEFPAKGAVGGLRDAVELNLEGNALTRLPDVRLSALARLESLVLTSNRLLRLPSDLSRCERLRAVYAAVNDIADATPAFEAPALLHLGLAHCRVASLPTPEIAAETALVSLDLAHNALESLPDALQALAAMPALRTLRLAGNPIALVPGYRALVLAALPRLRHLDGVSAADDDGRATSRDGCAGAAPADADADAAAEEEASEPAPGDPSAQSSADVEPAPPVEKEDEEDEEEAPAADPAAVTVLELEVIVADAELAADPDPEPEPGPGDDPSGEGTAEGSSPETADADDPAAAAAGEGGGGGEAEEGEEASEAAPPAHPAPPPTTFWIRARLPGGDFETSRERRPAPPPVPSDGDAEDGDAGGGGGDGDAPEDEGADGGEGGGGGGGARRTHSATRSVPVSVETRDALVRGVVLELWREDFGVKEEGASEAEGSSEADGEEGGEEVAAAEGEGGGGGGGEGEEAREDGAGEAEAEAGGEAEDASAEDASAEDASAEDASNAEAPSSASAAPSFESRVTLAGTAVVRLDAFVAGFGASVVSARVAFDAETPLFGAAKVGAVLLPIEGDGEAKPPAGSAEVTFTIRGAEKEGQGEEGEEGAP